MSTPTGNFRHRVHTKLFGKQLLVLQMEYEGDVMQYDGGYCEVKHQSWWVDAKPEWVMEHGLEIAFPPSKYADVVECPEEAL
ncbi:MAG: hypothetical protein V3S69_02915 [Dehalococcoidales bacterium]